MPTALLPCCALHWMAVTLCQRRSMPPSVTKLAGEARAVTSEMRGLTRVHMSMRPTMSVLLTPSVRLIIRKRPIFFTCAYASVPSAQHR